MKVSRYAGRWRRDPRYVGVSIPANLDHLRNGASDRRESVNDVAELLLEKKLIHELPIAGSVSASLTGMGLDRDRPA